MIFFDHLMQSFQRIYKSLLMLLLFLCWSLTITSGGLTAEQATGMDPLSRSGDANIARVATVIIDGNELFRVIGTSTFPAKLRAKLIAKKIKKLAQDPLFDPGTLEFKEVDGMAAIFAGDDRILIVTEEDALLEGSSSAEVLAKELYLKQISSAIENYRTERQRDVLLESFISASARTIALGVFLFFLFWLFRKTDQLLERHFKRKIEELAAKSRQVVRAQQIWSALKKVHSIVRVLLVLFALYFFVNFVMGLFPWTRYISKTLLGFIINPVLSMWEAFVSYLPSLVFLVILYFVFRYVLHVTYIFFQAVDRGQIKFINFQAEWAWPTYRLVRVLLFVLGLVIAYPYIPGSGSEAFKGISILLGVLFSLGSSSFISNIIAGYTMTYRRAFKVGDRVKIGTDLGEVTDVRLLVTHLRSLKNEEIIIPNSKILTGEITNYSSLAEKQGLILHTTVGIGYEIPWRQVEAMLLLAAQRTPGLKKDSQPFVLQTLLGDFGINYELNVFCSSADRMAQIYTELHRNIQDAFNEYGVAIMTPHYVGDTEQPKFVPKEQWYVPPAKPQEPEMNLKEDDKKEE